MLLTNLFRDQLDRYGEIDITMNILEEMMRKVPKMKIIVNGDDALSAYLAMDSGNPYVTYGISKPVIKSAANEIRKDVSVSDAVKNWNIVSIITASWEIIIVQNADLQDRSRILMRRM